jgi:hypothetical protein
MPLSRLDLFLQRNNLVGYKIKKAAGMTLIYSGGGGYRNTIERAPAQIGPGVKNLLTSPDYLVRFKYQQRPRNQNKPENKKQ